MTPSTKLLLTTAAFATLCAVAAAAAITMTNGCSADWNAPSPIIPEPGNPCGRDWAACAHGVCCYASDICRPGQTAEQTYCAFGGIEGPSWGVARDAGPPLPALYRALTPEQVQRQRGTP